MVNIGDPVASGLVSSLGRPGGSITGSTMLAPEIVRRDSSAAEGGRSRDLACHRLDRSDEPRPDVARPADGRRGRNLGRPASAGTHPNGGGSRQCLRGRATATSPGASRLPATAHASRISEARGICDPEPPADRNMAHTLRTSGRDDVLREKRCRAVSERRGRYSSTRSSRYEACRPSRGAADPAGTHHQHEDCQGARPDDRARGTSTSGSDHRMTDFGATGWRTARSSGPEARVARLRPLSVAFAAGIAMRSEVLSGGVSLH